jgi:hypothetical protein
VELPVPAHALPQRTPPELLAMARAGLAEAAVTRPVGLRYATAHLAALRAAAAIVAARAVPKSGVRRSRPTSLWVLVPQVAPELSDWCAMFAAGATKRAAAEAGVRCGVSAAEADGLCARAADFVAVVAVLLGETTAPVESPGDLADSDLPPALAALVDTTFERMSRTEQAVFARAWTSAMEAVPGADLSPVVGGFLDWRPDHLDAPPAVVGAKLVELAQAATR